MGKNLSLFNETQILIKLHKIEQKLDRILISSKWLDIKKAVLFSSLSESTLKRAIRQGTLKASRTTGKILIKDEWLNNYLEGK